MKYLLKVFFAIAVIFAFCGLAACGGGNDSTATKLTSPSNFRIEDGRLCWDEVEDAEGYAVFIDGMQYLTILHQPFCVMMANHTNVELKPF